METIVLASTSEALRNLMERQVPAALRKSATVSKIDPSVRFLDYLRYEIPDLVVLHAEDHPLQFLPLLEGLEQDPWLDSVGLILVVPDVDEVIEQYQGFNVAYFLEARHLERNLSRVIRILDEKRDFLNYDGIIKKITALSGELILQSDLLLVQYYSSLFSNYLFKEALVDRDTKYAIKLTLDELLTNAMEHGSAGISFADKTALQEQGRTVQDLMEERLIQPPWKSRTVTLSYSISPRESLFVIRDQGEGFNVEKLPSVDDLGDISHGRGILLARHAAHELNYNAQGNEVTVRFIHNGKAERAIPPGFIESEPRRFSPGDVVFWENTVGDHIYYIVSGEYDVFVGGKKIARLTPADVFMGEMSFLLGNRRTATVIAAVEGKLVEVSRQAFTEAVKQYPNYGIFLSKLLARRLRDNNRRYAS